AHEAAVDAFDREALATRDQDRRIPRVARQQADVVAPALQALDRHLAIDAGDDDLAVAGFRRALHAHQIAIENALLDHRVALDPEQVIRSPREQASVQPEFL